MSGVIDVGVVGAGPAGLGAALAPGDLGCEGTLNDAGTGGGGIEVGVVGAGPAGLAAALAAGDLGCEVTLIDAGHGSGGQRYHQSLLFPGPGGGARGHIPPGLAPIREG